VNGKIKTKPMRKTIDCLLCSQEIYIGSNPKIGNFISCDNCDSQFEIIDLEPVLIDWFYFDEFFEEEERDD
jgi:hypothetical protein